VDCFWVRALILILKKQKIVKAMIQKGTVRIPRTYDAKLDAMARVIRRWHRRMLKQNPHNPLARRPRMEFLALTATDSYNDWAIARKGTITTQHVKLTNPASSLYCECRPGTYPDGTGIAFLTRDCTQKTATRLEDIAEELIEESLYGKGKGIEDYYTRLAKMEKGSLRKLKSVLPEQDYNTAWKRGNHNVDHLHDIIKRCSAIIDDSARITNSKVNLEVIDEFRRYVNTESSVIFDYRYGIHIRFSATVKHENGMSWPLYWSFYFGDHREIDLDAMEKQAKNFRKMLVDRSTCEIAKPYSGPVLLEPTIFASEIHESLVHLLASDAILEDKSTALGIESFGTQVGPEELSIFSDPSLKNWSWGFYKYDQEGVAAPRTPLIENGRHAGFLADRHGAYVLSKLVKEDIPAGNSLTSVVDSLSEEDGFVLFNPQPRIGVFDVVWNGKTHSKKELKKLFIRMLREQGLKEGLVVTTCGCPGYSFAEEGLIYVTYQAPFMMDLKGRKRPVTPMFSSGDARHNLRNIVAMTTRKDYVAHRCGDGEGMAEVRAAINCGHGIMDNMSVKPIRKDRKEKERPQYQHW